MARFRWSAKLTALAAFCLLVVGAGAGLYFGNVGHVRVRDQSHQVVVPSALDGFSRSPSLEQQLGVVAEAQSAGQAGRGQASHVVSAVYQRGSSVAGSPAQLFTFIGGNLSDGRPGASVASFEQAYPGAKAAAPGPLGGQAACTPTRQSGRSVSMCVWFDNDTFGTLVSPTMTSAELAALLVTVRPGIEQPLTR